MDDLGEYIVAAAATILFKKKGDDVILWRTGAENVVKESGEELVFRWEYRNIFILSQLNFFQRVLRTYGVRSAK